MKIKDILKQILTIRNENGNKAVTIFNKKFIFKNTRTKLKYLELQLEKNLNSINQLKFLIDSCCDITNCKKATGILRETQLIRLKALKFLVDVFEENGIQYWIDGGSCLGVYRHKGFIPWDDDIDMVVPRPYYQKAIDLVNERLSDSDIKIRIGGIKPDGNPYSALARLMDTKTHFGYVDIFTYDYCNNPNLTKETLLLKLKSLREDIFSNTFNKKLHSGKVDIQEFINYVQKKYEQYEIVIPNGRNCYMFRAVETMSLRLEQTIHNVEDIFPLTKGGFETLQVNTPNNIEQFLHNINEGSYGDLMAFPNLEIMHSYDSCNDNKSDEYKNVLEIQNKKIDKILND